MICRPKTYAVFAVSGIFTSSMKFIFTSIAVFILVAAKAQVAAAPVPQVVLRGVVFDVEDSSAVLSPMIINKSTGKGFYSAAGAPFVVTISKTDTLLITAGGYNGFRICLRDSVLRSEYKVRIGLRMRVQQVQTVTIYPLKELEQIKKERENLGVKFNYQVERPLEMAASPITALYERFSRRGQSMKLVAELENQDRQREVMKDLFRLYVKADIIELEEEEFDKFIIYLNLPEEFLRTASDYDLVAAVKSRYVQFREVERIHRRGQH